MRRPSDPILTTLPATNTSTIQRRRDPFGPYKIFDEDAILDPHYVDEIAMLERSLKDALHTMADGGENTRNRLAVLRKHAPYFDGVTMIRNTEAWPCQCERCVPVPMAEGQYP